jgi:hypothetical protein
MHMGHSNCGAWVGCSRTNLETQYMTYNMLQQGIGSPLLTSNTPAIAYNSDGPEQYRCPQSVSPSMSTSISNIQGLPLCCQQLLHLADLAPRVHHTLRRERVLARLCSKITHQVTCQDRCIGTLSRLMLSVHCKAIIPKHLM